MKGKKMTSKPARYAGGNPYVIEDAKERKRGGFVKKGMSAEGEKSKHRMDRPKRASGGRVGSDKNPFSSARKGTLPTGRKEMQME